MLIDDNTSFEDIVTSQWFLRSSGTMQEAIWLKPPNRYYSINNKQVVVIGYNMPVSDSIADVTLNVRKTGVVRGRHDPWYGLTEKDHVINNLSIDDLDDWSNDSNPILS